MNRNTINCWEYKKCGREPGGSAASSLGVCPAAVQDRYHEINNGINGGRFCWIVENTQCDGIYDDSFLDKFERCLKCDFYLLVQKQQARHLVVVHQDML